MEKWWSWLALVHFILVVEEVDTMLLMKKCEDCQSVQGLTFLFAGWILIGCAEVDVESHWWPHKLPEVLLFSDWTGRYYLLGG